MIQRDARNEKMKETQREAERCCGEQAIYWRDCGEKCQSGEPWVNPVFGLQIRVFRNPDMLLQAQESICQLPGPL